MSRYELLYIISSDATEEKREELIAKFRAYIEGVEKWGMRKLAYPINFKNEGFYVLMKMEMPNLEVDAMGKLLNITDGIIRHQFARI